MDSRFPYVSTYDTEFAFDFGLALTEPQAEQIAAVKGDEATVRPSGSRSGRGGSGPS